MASTLQMTGPLTTADEATIAGVRRSRLSLHLNTPHVRRWLLVQLVSIPTDAATKEQSTSNAQLAQPEAPRRNNFGRLLDDYVNVQTLRRPV